MKPMNGKQVTCLDMKSEPPSILTEEPPPQVEISYDHHAVPDQVEGDNYVGITYR